jgi:hypothetical protein
MSGRGLEPERVPEFDPQDSEGLDASQRHGKDVAETDFLELAERTDQ